jgi:phosphoribosylanthranilate isomerase
MWVKICGIRDVSTAERVASLRPDAIGLNFYENSPRRVSASVSLKITVELPDAVASVGVFVNHAVYQAAYIAREFGLTMIQLHGDESPEFAASLHEQLPAAKLIRAWRMGETLAELVEHLTECRNLAVPLAACLLDANVPGAFGGTGTQPPWDALRSGYRREVWPPLILAGGLSPENVGAGIAAVQPWGVDVASGVEASPGMKELARVERFVTAARGGT